MFVALHRKIARTTRMNPVSKDALLAMREEAATSVEKLTGQLADARRELSAVEDLLRIRHGWIPERLATSSKAGLHLADFEGWAKDEWLPMFKKGSELTTSQFSKWMTEHRAAGEEEARIRNLIGLTFKKLVADGLIALVRKGEGRAPSIYAKQ